MDRALRNRLTFGPIMLLALVGVLWLDWYIEKHTGRWMFRHFGATRGLSGVGLAAMLMVILPLATRELATLFAAERVMPYRVIAAAGTVALIGHAFLTQFPAFRPIAASTLAFIIVFVMLLAALRRALNRVSEDAIVSMAGTLLATMYLGGLGWFLVALRVKQSELASGFHGSTVYVVLILLCVKFTDIGAYFSGKALGRHKLIPWLSPGKTWEGLAGGLLVAGLTGTVCAILLLRDLTWPQGLVFGIVIGGVGQLGDLLESLMKRDADLKDSGTLIPGFGGILDVIDSPLLAAPFAYLLLSLF